MEASLCVLYIKKNVCVTTQLDWRVLFYIVCAVLSTLIWVDLVSLIVYNPGHLQSCSTELGGGFLGW